MKKNKKINKSDIYKLLLRSNYFLSSAQLRLMLDLFFDKILESVVNGKRVEIRGLGSFRLHKRSGYMARNPRTGEKVLTPEKKIVKFRCSKKIISNISDRIK